MSEANYSELLRALSKEYCQGYIELGDYRARRKTILDSIDFDYNGVQESTEVVGSNEQHLSSEEDVESLFGKVLSIFKQDNESN